MDESEKPADAQAKAPPESASVVAATFESRHAAERMVASLGHEFRHRAQKGDVNAFVVTRRRDGAFKLAQSRVLTEGGVAGAAIKFASETMVGLMGIGAAIRGVKTVVHSAHERQSHVQADHRLTELLDQVGEHSAALLVLCKDEQTTQAVASRASERGTQSMHVSRAKFLEALDRLGDNYDWLRPVVGETATPPQRGG